MKKAFFLIAFIAIAAVTAQAGLAASPGSSGDPLASKSYVDDKFNQLITLLTSGVELPTVTQPTVAPAETAGATYTPVSAGVGQILLGDEGTEIILRSGKAIGYCTGANGMVDVTSGTEVFNGDTIYANHLLIVPRGDGRGVVAASDAWFIVKGGYSLR